MSLFKYLFSGILLFLKFHKAAADCEIGPFGPNAPLVIKQTTILYPNHGEKTLKFQSGDIVEFACPQRQVIVNGTATQAVVEAICISDTRFTVNGHRFLFRQISCSDNPISVGRFLDSNCGTNARLAEIGFDLGDDRFVPIMTICFDTKNQSTLYSYHNLITSTRSHDTSTAGPAFAEDSEFYNIGSNTVNEMYLRTRQRRTINALLGLAESSIKYIDNEQLFLSRGHLTARPDFIYEALQNATFRYINVAPRWQTFNGANWDRVEVDTRNYAKKHNVDLQVWTGTYGVATLPHEGSREDVELYLYVDGNTKAIPVPAIYWKIIYEPITKQGIVLIGLNNPYKNIVSEYTLCPDVSNQVTWLTWNQDNIHQGYCYACTVSSFREAVAYAPNIDVSDLLM